MDKSKHLQPKDYDQIIANCMVEPDYNIAEYLEGQFSEHSQSNANFMQGLEDAFDREESKSKYNNIKIVIAANKGHVSDPRIDKLKIIATWGEIKKQNIDLERKRQLLKQCKQGIYRIEKGLHELENAPDFGSMFVIDPTPCEIKEGEAFTSGYGIEKQHRFNINNLQILTEPGVIREAYFRNYVNVLSILLSERLKASEIADFLSYHYQNAIDKTGLINFIRFDLWDYISETGINPHRKEIIMQWTVNIAPATITPESKLPATVTETTEQKIKRILEPLRGAFDNTTHIDKIINALVEYSDSATYPAKPETKIIQVLNPEFYPPFKQVKNETRLTVPGIASVLVYFICQNNGTGNTIAQSTIEKNINLNY